MILSFLAGMGKGKGSKAIALALACLSIFAVLVLYYTQNSFLDAFEAKTYDLRFKRLRGPIPASPDIAIVAIDDKSIRELGRFPWSRSQYVPLLQKLSAAKAKAVLFDAFYPERESVAADRAFATAIQKAGNVVMAVSFDFDKSMRVVGETRSLPEIERAAAGVGHINMLPEDDGVIRRNFLLIETQGKTLPSLGLQGAMAALGVKTFEAGAFEVRVGERAIPVNGSQAMWINYTGRTGNYPRYSFTDIVHGRVDPVLLKGKVLFVGATALGIYDMRVTPFDANTPGVEVHATVADNIISGHFIRQSGLEALFDMALIVVMGALTFYLTMRMRLYGALPATLLLAAAYVWLSYWMFTAGHWVSMVYPPLAAIAALLVGGSFRYLVLERSAREMRSMFSSYLSDKLVSRLEHEPDAARIGGDIKEVTILFTDIKGFTTFSEKHTPQEVVARLNEYLGAMVQIIEEFDGTVDKFIGDGIMAYWGAPLAQAEHARLAVACMLAMRKKMEELAGKWIREGVDVFSIRGGVQSGEVVAGNIGFRGKKMEYTVIGDTVNQAARLEGTAKYYGVQFLVGESTYQLTCGDYRYRELDKVRVVGKQVPVTIYELCGTLAEPESVLIQRFNAALAIFRARRWHEADVAFAAILQECGDDTPSRIYRERCEHFDKTPPPPDWDGVSNRRDK